MSKHIDILGVGFQNADLATAIDSDIDIIRAKAPCHQIVFANAYSVCMFHENSIFRSAVQSAAKVYADGISVRFASFVLAKSRLQRVAGPDYFCKMLERCQDEKIPCFFLGCGNEDELMILRQFISLNYGSYVWGGGFSPPFGVWDENLTESIINRVNESNSSILWVGVGSPKQDVFIREICHRINVSIAAGVGAAFDFTTGKTNRAPTLMRQLGLEWFHRLATNPKRLWKRYIFGNARFMILVLKQLVNFNKRSSNA